MKSQGIELVEECNEAVPILKVDAEKLRACFINVVANAIQAMPDGGTMRITFRRIGDGSMVISFSDTGAGIEARVAGHVFEPFFTTKRDGIGLGLFFVEGDCRDAWRYNRSRAESGRTRNHFDFHLPRAR